MRRIKAQAVKLCGILGGGGWLAVFASGAFFALLAVLLEGRMYGLWFSDLLFVERMNWPLLFGAAAVAVVVLLVTVWFFESIRPLIFALPLLALAFSLFLALCSESSVYFSLGLCVPVFFALRWALGESPPRLGVARKIPSWAVHSAVVVLFLLFTALLSYASILRYRSYNATNFDLGIFAQMFEFLRKTGHAWTTLERNTLLSHFGVHCSPFYYLLLPFYCLVPRVETLLVLQAAAVGAGVFAVRAIAAHCFGDSPRAVFAACLLYAIHPAFLSGTLYDFHENKFLAVLLLWAAYFLLKNKSAPFLIFAVLALSVKEDAAIYIFSLGLWQLCRTGQAKKRRLLFGLLPVVLAVLWFAAAVMVVRHFGDGVMLSRLRNFFPQGGMEGGFGDVLRTLVSDFGYVILQVFTAEKMEFLLWMFLPLGFAPFLAKRNAAWLLLLPLLVLNLLSNYDYQHTMGFQYTYGSAALALLLALLCLGRASPALRRKLLLYGIVGGLLCTAPLSGQRTQFYLHEWRVSRTDYLQADQVLSALPEDAAVMATTWFAPHLAARREVYMYPDYYGKAPLADIFLCKPEEPGESAELAIFLAENYHLQQSSNMVAVYRVND
ncbi:MAG: DUF2079 domain-containing protein [Oscillospiraceae bacterium]|nr:DUF2079 domain-containing protein [Oscillospiraceae bacterium]